MQRPRGILFDLDGVIYNADEPILGAQTALGWAVERKIPHLFVTNTTSHDRESLARKLQGFGIAANPGQIHTPAATAAAYLRDEHAGPVALFVPDGIRGEFAECELTPDDAETGAECVVLGDLGDGWSYATLNRAFRLLHSNPDCRMIALGMTRYWRAPDGISLDVAPFAAALTYATGRNAVVLGKPARGFFAAGCRRLGLDAAETLMIGDDVKTDVGGAQDAGLLGALVRTGKFRPSDLDDAVEPDWVLDSVADLPELWEGITNPSGHAEP